MGWTTNSGDNVVDICVDLELLGDHLQRNGPLHRHRICVLGWMVKVQLSTAQGDHLRHCHLCLLRNESVFHLESPPSFSILMPSDFLMKRIRFGNLTHLVLVLTSKSSCYILLFFPLYFEILELRQSMFKNSPERKPATPSEHLITSSPTWCSGRSMWLSSTLPRSCLPSCGQISLLCAFSIRVRRRRSKYDWKFFVR